MSSPLEALSWLVQPEPWMNNGACKGLDPGMFHMEQGQSAVKAREVCDTCSVQMECREYAERTGSVGVWGGQVFTLKRVRKVEPITKLQDARPVKLAAPSRRRNSPTRSSGQIAASRAR